jgi:glycerol uptake facilitator-like aquaporin
VARFSLPPELRKSIAPCATEFIGTFYLTLTVALAGGSANGPFMTGAMLYALIYAMLYVSGGYLNPASCIALWFRGDLPLRKCVLYSIMELAAAFAATGVAALWKDRESLAYPHVAPGVSIASAIACETLFTFALMFVVLWIPFESPMFGASIALVVVAIIGAAGPISGAALNPALGTALVAMAAPDAGGVDRQQTILVYWIGPVLGAVLAACASMLLQPHEFLPKEYKYKPLNTMPEPTRLT